MGEQDDRFYEAVSLVQRHAPEYRTKIKRDVWYNKLLNKLLGSWTSFWTTVGRTTYRPVECNRGASDKEWIMILHEGIHVLQAKRFTRPFFLFLYLIPFFRAWAETEAYKVTMAAQYWYKGSLNYNEDIDWIVNDFTGKSYLFMNPNKGSVQRTFRNWHLRLVNNERMLGKYLNDVKQLACRYRREDADNNL